jgi:hypothetical protein
MTEFPPEWSLQLGRALDLERQATAVRKEAWAKRCPYTDSGGSQCTADAQPEHQHRHRQEDLPK